MQTMGSVKKERKAFLRRFVGRSVSSWQQRTTVM
jgi:hypothetical protein